MNTAKSEAVSFHSGVPTAPDVEALCKAFQDIKPRAVIPWEAFENVVGADRRKARFKTVVAAWRRKLYRESNILFRACHGVGLEYCDPMARIDVGGAKYESGVKNMLRARDIAANTDSDALSPDARKAQDHIVRTTAQIALAMKTSARRLKLAAPDIEK